MTELEDRLRTATAGLPRLPDDLDEVRARGRRRRWVGRIGTVTVVLAGLVLAGSVALERYDDRPVPIVGEPGPEATPTTEPSPSPDDSTRTSSPAEPGDEIATVGLDELPWPIVARRAEWVVMWKDGKWTELASRPVQRLRWLPETGAVGQGAEGDPIVPLGPGPGDGAELVGAREGLILEAAGVAPDGREVLLVTWTRPAAELGPEIVLGLVDIATAGIEELGVVGNREDGPDGMAIDHLGVVWATCHLQCGLATLPLTEGEGESREIAPADWRAGVALAGETVATVAFDFDPEEGRPSAARLVLHDRVTGDVLRDLSLADVDGWDVDVSLLADGTAALVTLGPRGGPGTRTYVVDGLLDDPRVRLLEGVSGPAVFADQ